MGKVWRRGQEQNRLPGILLLNYEAHALTKHDNAGCVDRRHGTLTNTYVGPVRLGRVPWCAETRNGLGSLTFLALPLRIAYGFEVTAMRANCGVNLLPWWGRVPARNTVLRSWPILRGGWQMPIGQ